jgi:hypothetical protein
MRRVILLPARQLLGVHRSSSQQSAREMFRAAVAELCFAGTVCLDEEEEGGAAQRALCDVMQALRGLATSRPSISFADATAVNDQLRDVLWARHLSVAISQLEKRAGPSMSDSSWCSDAVSLGVELAGMSLAAELSETASGTARQKEMLTQFLQMVGAQYELVRSSERRIPLVPSEYEEETERLSLKFSRALFKSLAIAAATACPTKGVAEADGRRLDSQTRGEKLCCRVALGPLLALIGRQLILLEGTLQARACRHRLEPVGRVAPLVHSAMVRNTVLLCFPAVERAEVASFLDPSFDDRRLHNKFASDGLVCAVPLLSRLLGLRGEPMQCGYPLRLGGFEDSHFGNLPRHELLRINDQLSSIGQNSGPDTVL